MTPRDLTYLERKRADRRADNIQFYAALAVAVGLTAMAVGALCLSTGCAPHAAPVAATPAPKAEPDGLTQPELACVVATTECGAPDAAAVVDACEIRPALSDVVAKAMAAVARGHSVAESVRERARQRSTNQTEL